MMGTWLNPVLANGWAQVEQMFFLVLALALGGGLLTLVLALRPVTRQMAFFVGLAVTLACLGLLFAIFLRM
jgi:hypothetical protein